MQETNCSQCGITLGLSRYRPRQSWIQSGCMCGDCWMNLHRQYKDKTKIEKFADSYDRQNSKYGKYVYLIAGLGLLTGILLLF